MFFKYFKQRKRISLSVNRDGSIKLSAPPGFPEHRIEEFLKKSAPWVEKRRAELKKYKYLPEGTGTKRHFAKHKEAARKFITERVTFWNSQLGFSFAKIAIRNQKSRWGSCSKKHILNFNYRLLLLPPELADYVVVHELCHLKHFNHSKDFWALVAESVPNHMALRKELKKYQM